MKISITKVLEDIISSAVDYPEGDRKLNEFFLDQIYLLESGFGNKNNIEEIVAEVFSHKKKSDFMEIIDIICRAKNHKIAEKPILQIMQLADFYFYKNDHEEEVLKIFREVDDFYEESRPSKYLIRSCSKVVSDPKERLEKYGCLNYFTQSLHNNYLNLLYKQEDLNPYMMKFNKAMTDIYRKIKEKGVEFADQITNVIMIGMNIKNLFERLVNELIGHNSSKAIIYTKLLFPLLFSQLPLHYLWNQNDLILWIIGGIDLEKLPENDRKKIQEWDSLFLKLRKKLYDATVIGGTCNILDSEGVECDIMNYFDKHFLQILQLKVVEIREIRKHPNSDRLNLCTVFDGQEEREVVCGAGNVHKIKDNNLKTVLAQTGQLVPNGLVLEPKEIRGVVSDGMLCSLEELRADFIDNVPEGIAELDSDSILGVSPFLKIMDHFNLSEIVDLSITPNLGYTIGLCNLEELLKSYILTDHYHLSGQFINYLRKDSESEKIFKKAENPLIFCDDEKITSEIIENIFYSTCKSEDYKQLDISVKNLLISHGFEIHGDIRDNFNYAYILTGFSFHIVDLDKISGGKLRVVFNKKDHDGLENGDIIVVDEAENIIAIPGIKDIERYSFDSKSTKNILFFSFIFHDNPMSNSEIGFNKMLQIARRNKISNNMIYFFERSRINPTFIETAFANVKNQDMEGKNLFYCLNEALKIPDNWFKFVKFKISDIVLLFKKVGLLSYIDAMEGSKNPMVDFPKVGHHCCMVLAKLGIIDYDLMDNPNFSISSNDEDGLHCVLPVYKHRVEINYSMDVAAALCKYFVHENGLEILYDGFYEGFFNEEVDYESTEDDELKLQDYSSYFNYSDLDHEEIDSLKYGDYGKLKLQRKLCQSLVNRGYNELCNFSFVDKKTSRFDDRFLIELSSPVNKNLNILRSSIFSSLLENLVEISKSFEGNVSIFEVGPVYTSYNIFQKNIVGIRFGTKYPRNVYSKDKNDFDFYDVKADFLEVLKVYNIEEDKLKFYRLDDFYEEKDGLVDILQERKLIKIDKGEIFDQNKEFFHGGESAIVFYKDLPLGYLGEIHPKILQDYDFNHNIVGFVLICEVLNELGKLKKSSLFQSQYQAVTRDFALIFDEILSIDDIKSAIKDSQKSEENILREISIFDIYRDEKLKTQNKKSVAFSVKLQSQKQTLSEKMIKEATDSILNILKERYNGYMLFEENK